MNVYIKLWDDQRVGMFDSTGSTESCVWGFVISTAEYDLGWFFVWDGTYPAV